MPGSDSLQHWGILGMKWGRRKAQDSASSGGGGGKDGNTQQDTGGGNHSEDHRKVTELRKKKASELSNAEIQAVLNRANLEKQFAELNKKQVSAGQKFVTDLIVSVGQEQAKKFASSYADQARANLMKSLVKTAATAATKP